MRQLHQRASNMVKDLLLFSPILRCTKNDPAICIAGSGKGLIGWKPSSLRVARLLYARIVAILLDESDIPLP
jgi:hypothetical protein